MATTIIFNDGTSNKVINPKIEFWEVKKGFLVWGKVKTTALGPVTVEEHYIPASRIKEIEVIY